MESFPVAAFLRLHPVAGIDACHLSHRAPLNSIDSAQELYIPLSLWRSLPRVSVFDESICKTCIASLRMGSIQKSIFSIHLILVEDGECQSRVSAI